MSAAHSSLPAPFHKLIHFIGQLRRDFTPGAFLQTQHPISSRDAVAPIVGISPGIKSISIYVRFFSLRMDTFWSWVEWLVQLMTQAWLATESLGVWHFHSLQQLRRNVTMLSILSTFVSELVSNQSVLRDWYLTMYCFKDYYETSGHWNAYV